MPDNFTKVSPTVLGVKVLGSYITGLDVSVGTDTSHDIDISTGFCKDSTYEYILDLESPLTKRVDDFFTEGDGVGGIAKEALDTADSEAFTIQQMYDKAPIGALSDTKTLVSYIDKDNSYAGTARVLDIVGGAITYGTDVAVTSAADDLSMAILSPTKAIVAYRDIANSGYGTACILNISGSVVTYSIPFEFNTASTNYTAISTLSETQAVVIYRDGGNSNYGTALVLNISGDNITKGTPKVFEESAFLANSSITTLSTTKAIVAYEDGDNSSRGTACVLNISGNDITHSIPEPFNDVAISWPSISTLNETKAIVAYYDNAVDSCVACVLNISGNSITPGIITTVESEVSDWVTITALSETKAIVAYSVYNIPYRITMCPLDISGSTIVAATPKNINSAYAEFITIGKLNDSQAIVTYADYGNGEKGTASLLEYIIEPEAYYYPWLMKKDDGGAIDVILSTNMLNLAPPIGYTYTRRLPYIIATDINSNIYTVAELKKYANTTNDLYGYEVSINSTDSAHDIDIAPGYTISSEDNIEINLYRPITKQIDAYWEIGNNRGGRDGVLSADTWYYLWLIRRDADGLVDVIISTSSTDPNMPSGYTYKRKLPWGIFTDGAGDIDTISEFKKYVNHKDESYGFQLSNSTDFNHDIQIEPGHTLSDIDDAEINLFIPLIKRIDAAWVAGGNQGGLDIGSSPIANTWYYIWVIKKDSDETVDALFSLNDTSPDMPSGYTYKKLIGAIITNSSSNIMNNNWGILDVIRNRGALLVIDEKQPYNTATSTYAGGAWRTRILNTVRINEIPGAYLSSNQITLPKGTYHIQGGVPITGNMSMKLAIYNLTDFRFEVIGPHADSSDYSHEEEDAHIDGIFTLNGTKTIELRQYSSSTVSCPRYSVAGVEEIYCTTRFTKLY